MLFERLLDSVILDGTLHLKDSRGRIQSFGNGNRPRCTLRLRRSGPKWAALLNFPLFVGEAYMDGDLTIEDGTLEDFLELAARNYRNLDRLRLLRLALVLARQGRWVKQHNPMARARANVAHHYDLSGELYDLFLDTDRQYSCAYFESPQDGLEQAQENKKRHIASKLLLDRPDMRVLDIGSGWGGLGLYLAQAADCRVKGLTLSVEQHGVSQTRARDQGLAERVQFDLRDYRDEDQRYDRIVSVGMFEHVGKGNYAEFFRKVRDLMRDDGVCLLHSIGRFNRPGPINPFMRKYIFPGADLPTLSEVLAAVEASGLLVTDVEILRLHYAQTLRHWFERFQANRSKVARLYDERFCRMWELYLKGCEMGFRHQGLMVFQVQLAKRMDSLPLTRGYMYDWERDRAAGHAQAAE